jgi:hypothetical protein
MLALETVNCVCSGKCCRQLIPKCDRPGEVWVFVAVFWCLHLDLCVWFWCQLELIGLNMVWQLSGVWLCKRIWVCTLCGAPQVGPSFTTEDLYMRCLCDTLSKALAKSIIMRSVWMFLSDDLARSWMNDTSCVSQERDDLNPCWRSYNILLYSRSLKMELISCYKI